MKLSKPLFTLLILIAQFVGIKSYSQQSAYTIIKNLPSTEWSGKEKGAALSSDERVERLKILPKGERIEFIMNYSDEDDTVLYRPLFADGLYYLDLDFDGDLDLLYSAISGAMAQTATKIYYNQDNKLIYHATLRDGILDIKKNKENYRIYTLFTPCCDSYTSRIDQYSFSANDTAIFIESISLIGRAYASIQGMPDFKTARTALVNSPSIYALPSDFRNVHGYFRERNKEVRGIIRARNILELIKLDGEVMVNILSEASFKEEKYLLIITEPLENLPRMPVSLYEWSAGNGRRLVGWVKEKDLKSN